MKDSINWGMYARFVNKIRLVIIGFYIRDRVGKFVENFKRRTHRQQKQLSTLLPAFYEAYELRGTQDPF